MIITKVIMNHVRMRLREPFHTSFGTIQDKDIAVIEVIDEKGNSGWGESVALPDPTYTEETFKTNWHILEDYLIPLLLNREISHPDEVGVIFSPIRRNYMAKAAIEGAVWDLYAKRSDLSLSDALGGTRKSIEAGISIGIQQSKEELFKKIEGYLEEGFKRIKIKIKPGMDVEIIKAVRERFPDVPLMADANSAYTLKDTDHLRKLDEFNLLMIEQPLGADDIINHAKLQKAIKTPICLDESIQSLDDVKKAVELGSCQIINIKIGRVGGLSSARDIHQYCKENGIAVWCGGMLEAGIGRAFNIALSSLENFTLPGDTAGSARYWEEDIINPEVVVVDGLIEVPSSIGIGYEPNRETIKKYTVNQTIYSK
ncbi:o-succinylbenzoate synthase [Cytobacillus gottheilii]|uniref:o-succinylbenzoate synthase n=1 Tax=Cytobacillus gottheilii TaxID=859144 RepID=A0ABX8F9S3_9BACI|nr:o-succinylbenzoate synthase [Cytobacillus gottheilii]QVY59892.1 o-succinylbenzoate synthase [Cytobacillus gottheilii]